MSLLNLPVDHPCRGGAGSRGSRSILWPQGAERELRAAARQLESTPGRVALAALVALLHRYTGQEEILPEVACQGSMLFGDLARSLPAETLDHAQVQFAYGEAAAVGDATELAFSATGEAGGLRLTAAYDTALFEAATVERLLVHYRTLLAGAIEHPDLPLWQLPLLTESERELLVTEWNRTGRPYPTHETVHELVARQAEATPDRVAVVYGTERVTYAELNRRADRLAAHLRSLGVGPDTLAAVYLDRSPAMVAALLAILKAGGAYVPLDPNYPADRVAYILADSRAAVVLTSRALAGRLPESEARVAVLEEMEQAPLPAAGGIAEAAGPGNLAYIIYTSGSTGRPKGVALEHRSAVQMLYWARETFSDAERDGVLFSTSISFDIHIFEVFGTLAWGGKLIVAANALALPDLPARGEVVLINTVPSAMAELLRMGGVPNSVRVVNLAGEPISRRLADQVYALPHVEKLWDLYGPTEDTVYSTYGLVERSGDRAPAIGRPLPNSQAYVLDPHMEPVPLGAPGELWLGGLGLARGYLHRPDLTAERFVETAWGRLYRTGDLVRYLPDGRLEYLGRLDHQVKIRGFRIELGEIEAALAKYPGVGDLVVTAREDVPGDKRVVAYLTARGGAPTVAELRAFLKERLPDYMVPAAFVIMAALPLLPNGKVNRQALPAPDYAVGGAGYVAPGTPEEEALAAIWAQVLRVERVGIHDDFFAMGGHSLLATQVVSRVRAAFGVELPLPVFFESPTVAGLAERMAGEATRRKAPPMLPADRSQPLPLSFAQQRLWFFDQFTPQSPLYNIAEAIRLEGPLHAALLEESLNRLVARHEALRTNFVTQGRDPVQAIRPDLRLPLPVVDATEAEVEELVRAEACRPFDLTADPLIRATLLRLGADVHLLLLTVHHIVSDGWSLGVLYAELGQIYEALRAGREPALPELPVQYADFTQWQRAYLRDETLDEQLAYWTQELAGAPTVLELPTDRPRPAMQSFRGQKRSLPLSAELVGKLHALSRGEGATLFMTMLAAFQVLLHRYSGQEELLAGVAIANRNRAETEGLIGFFVNTLAMRADFGGKPTFRQFLQQVRRRALGAFAHQDLPLERLVEALQPGRDPSRAPLIQVLFALQNAPMDDLQLEGVRLTNLEPAGVDTGTAKYDLVLTVEEAGGVTRAVAEYCTDLYDEATIERLLGHYGTLLAAVAADPDRPVAGLPLLTPAEEQVLLTEWSGARTDYPEVAIGALFEEQVRLRPDAVAVEFGATRLTYAELNARANRLAHHLRALGVGPDQLVSLCVERSPELIVGLLAIVKAGGAYVPLDPTYPQDRLAFMLADTASNVLLTQSHLRERLPAHGARVICLDEDWTAIEGSDENPDAGVAPHHLAYVSYTSGSTGRPKGVLVPHRAVVRLVRNTNYADLGPEQVFLQLAPVAFDASTLEIWGALLNGGRLVVMPPHQPTLEELAQALVEHRVTVLWLTAGLFHLMVEHHLEALLSVRQVLAGGDVLSLPHVRKVLAGLKEGHTLINGYGPTENTTFTTCFPMTRETVLEGSVPIGRPIANTQCYILDPYLQPVPQGVAGELYTGGDGLAREYLNQPELTAQRFVSTPFGRLYKTGDLVRYRADGAIEFLGRLDHQVKIRGFRIELGEIEAVLGTHPAVAEALVMAREDGATGKRLVAYLTARPGQEAPTPADLRAYLKERLPEYMVPAAIVLLDAFPLNPNGKVERKALPVPEIEGSAEFAAPRTPLEERLAAIFAEVLEVERVSIHDHFFDLGGHSLLAIRVVSRVREALQAELPLRTLFERPTVAQLAEALGAEAAALTLPPIRPVDRDGKLPLSFAQQRLWFLYQWEPDTALYNIPVAYRMQGPLNQAALCQAIDLVVARHESLRTTFADNAQIVHEPAPLAVAVVDLTHLEPEERESEALRLAGEEGRRPFDLSTGPLLRATLIRLHEGDHLLLLTMHHIISDGWSLKVLMAELAAYYAACAEGRELELPALPVQYADFAAWQQQWLTGAELERQAAYWRRQLDGAPALLELPTDRPRPPVQTFRGRRKSFAVPPEVADGLARLSREQGATLFMTLLAAWNVLLHRYARQEEIAVGTPVAGRSRHETEGLVGFFVGTLVLRTDLTGEPTFVDLLRRVKEACLGAYAHQDLPFEKLVDLLHPERNLSYTPLFQVMFALQDNLLGDLQLPGLRMQSLEPETGTSKFDLTLDMAATSDGLTATLEYATDLFDEATIDRMSRHLTTLLASIVADPTAGVGRLNLLPEAERELLVTEWNRTGRPYPTQETAHELVARQAEAAPDRVAVVCGTDRVTYAELNRRADHLAAHLRSLGVGPDTLAAVYLDRSPAMVAALLAIWKAGGAYVPLDPNYPADRVAYILADSRAAVVLTSRALAGQLPKSEARVAVLEELEQATKPAAVGAAPEAGPGNLSYIIYTSGSTGRPKGVALEHRSVVQMLYWARETFSPAELDGVLFSTSICFDISVFELFATLAWGGKLIVAANALALPDLPARDEVVLINTVPSAMAELLRMGGVPSSVRVVNLAGEPISRRLADQVYALPHVEKLWDLYGPTEDTVYSTYGLVERTGDRAPAIGRPLPNTQAYVLDPHLQPVPLGAPGELWLGGLGQARGYLHRPDLTAERFVETAWGRLYRTGDLVRYLPDSRLEYLGRLDHQVKIRGFRIELGEIEAALAKHPGVGDLVVTAREDVPGDKRVVAYLTARGAAPTVAELRSFLKERLPDYMIPAAFVTMEALPLLPNGKVNRKALPAADMGLMETGRTYTAPRTPAEAVLAGVWSEVLGVHPVSIDDNYFELGGDSIRSIRVRTLAEERGLRLTLQDLFRYPTVRELAAVAGEGGAPAAARPALAPFALLKDADRAAMPAGVTDAYPQTRLQGGMLLHSLAAPETYRNTVGYELQAPFDEAALEAAAQQVVQRHTVLRTSFDVASYSEPLQLVHATAALPVTVVDLRDRADAAAVLERFIEGELRREWDWSRPPLARLTAHRLTDETFRLTLSFHHAILDGFSVTGMMGEWCQRYAALLSGETLPVEEPAAAFRDFVALEREAVASQEARAFWNSALAGAPATPLPFGAPAGELGRPQRNRFCEVEFDPALTAQLQDLARRTALPVKHLLLAAHVRVMGLLAGQTDVVTGLVTNGRPEAAGGDEVAGLFVNTVPFRLPLNGGTWVDLAREALAAEVRLLPHRRLPLPDIQQGHPLFEAYFNYTHFTASQPGSVRVLDVVNAAYSNFALALDFYMDPTAGRLRLFLEYDADRFNESQAHRLGGYYRHMLQALAARPEQSYLAPDCLPEEDRQLLLHRYNETAGAYDRHATIHRLFEQQAERTPQAVAAIFGEERLTYGELNRRANRLAHRLRALGVGPDARVGICLNRGLEMLVSLLAVLKAGGAYVPMDPAYPADRLAYMREDSGARVILSRHLTGEGVLAPDADEGPDHNPDSRAGADNLAYIIYTSGSTGRPKGVLLEHRGVVNLFASLDQRIGCGPGDVLLAVTSISFDISLLELFWTLTRGAAVVIVPELAATLRTEAVRHKPTMLQCTPSLMRLVMAEPGALVDLQSLRLLILGGEALPPSLAEQLKTALPIRLINAYGPTETTVYSTLYEVELPVAGSVPIGTPLANTQVYVLDAAGGLVPPGVPGELYIGGDGLARGYLNRPELTAERFVDSPFGRVYRTSDLVRWREDGVLEYLGRLDHQVKIRGLRIELGEIEARLAQHPAVREAVVTARQDPGGEARLVAYLTGVDGAEVPAPAELRAFCQETLPAFMIPAAYVRLAAFPLTPNGKVDRKALPEPDGGAVVTPANRPFEAPRSETEARVAAIWAEVLGVPAVSMHDRFLDLGGNSLMLTRILARLRDGFGLDVPLRILFEHDTAAGLAGALAALEQAAPAAAQRITPDMDADTARQWLERMDELTEEELDLLLTLVGDEEAEER